MYYYYYYYYYYAIIADKIYNLLRRCHLQLLRLCPSSVSRSHYSNYMKLESLGCNSKQLRCLHNLHTKIINQI